MVKDKNRSVVVIFFMFVKLLCCQPETLVKVFKLFANDKSSILLECQAQLVYAGPLNEPRLRQAQADNFKFKVIILILQFFQQVLIHYLLF